MPGKRLTSKDIELKIQELMKKKIELEKYENRFVIVEPLVERLVSIISNHNVSLTEGEIEVIVGPVRNVEKYLRDRFNKSLNAKKN